MKKHFEIRQYVEIEISDEKLEQILKDYRECIYSEAEIEDIFKQIAYHEAVLNSDFCEGIGEKGVDYFASCEEVEVEEE